MTFKQWVVKSAGTVATREALEDYETQMLEAEFLMAKLAADGLPPPPGTFLWSTADLPEDLWTTLFRQFERFTRAIGLPPLGVRWR